MPIIPSKIRSNIALLLIAFGFLLLQFIFELGIVYGASLFSNSAIGFINVYKNEFAVAHLIITLILIALAKRTCKSLYKDPT